MKTDLHGISTCPMCVLRTEVFVTPSGKARVWWDYRDASGALHSGITLSRTLAAEAMVLAAGRLLDVLLDIEACKSDIALARKELHRAVEERRAILQTEG